MNILDAVDWGGYAHFRFLASHQPGVVDAMQVVDQLGASDITFNVLALLALIVYAARGRSRALAVSLAVLLVGYAVATFLPPLIGRERPPDAQEMVGPDAMYDSFPARGVLLFTLAITLLAHAVAEALPTRTTRLLPHAVAAGLVVALCLSQFYLGLHFVTDVVAGLLGGLLLAVLARQLSARPEDAAETNTSPP